jgi:hypothetical protein
VLCHRQAAVVSSGRLVAVRGTGEGPTIGTGLDTVTTSLQRQEKKKSGNVVYDCFAFKEESEKKESTRAPFVLVVLL